MAFRYRSNRLALACSTVLVTACSLGNPYVVREAGDPRQNFCVDRNQCTVAEAKSSAFELAQLYRNKLSAHARMEAAVGAGGIVLGSAVLALAIADAHPDAYGAAGVIGATVYGLNTWYSNKPREEIYAKGLLALSCAATAVRAVDVPTTERAKLRDTAKVLAAISGVSDAARRLLADANAGMGSAEERVQAAAMLEQAQADLTAANNVLAHVPDINDFVAGFGILLKPNGVATFEFPHLLRLIEESQFDTIYHEHFSYLSLTAVTRIFAANGLSVFDVQELPTHGGSLRVFAQRGDTGQHPVTPGVADLLLRESRSGLAEHRGYAGFQDKTNRVKDDFLAFLLQARRDGKRVAAYGAAAKGNTLMNYAGIRPDLIAYVVDRNPAKQGKYMPGSRIPIVEEARLQTEKPDFVVILPWNLRTEVMQQLEYIRAWGGQFVTAVPELRVTP